LKSIIAQRIIDLTKTHDLLLINQMSKQKKSQLRNDFKIIYQTNSHNLKHEQRQNDYVFEHENCRDLRSCLENKIITQSSKKKNFHMNYRLNEQFHAKSTHHSRYKQRHDDNEQRQRRHIAKIFSFFSYCICFTTLIF
jgi:hypothetical protein